MSIPEKDRDKRPRIRQPLKTVIADFRVVVEARRKGEMDKTEARELASSIVADHTERQLFRQ